MLRKVSTEGPRGAPPDTTNLTRPPKAAFTVFSTVLSMMGLICTPCIVGEHTCIKEAHCKSAL